MATDLKRFTVSLTPDIEAELDIVKKKLFYNTTQSEMIRAILVKGLDVIKGEHSSTVN